jgi:hypothetical protein
MSRNFRAHGLRSRRRQSAHYLSEKLEPADVGGYYSTG